MTGKMKRLKSRCLLALCLSAAPAVLHALGLGEIHLHSALNEPLRADIELLSATPEELRTLTAAVASRETLARYGVEPSRQLSNLQFDVARDEAGRNVLRVTSTRAIDDPFLTFLVEVSWPRGRLLREYTLLLDPPVYMPGEAGQGPAVAPPQAQTPRTTEPQRSAEPATRPISAEDPQPQDSTALPSTPARSAAPTGDATSYTVQQNDTLWRISSELTADGGPREINRMMVAMFRANPEAFRGNINDLRAGAILRIPGGSELEALGPGEATAEVRRQYAEWRAQRGESESARLKLVTPAEPAVVGSGAAAGDTSALNQKVRELETQLAETHRMLELKNAELARLQQRLGETAAAEPAPPAETPSTTQPEASPATQAEAPPIDAQTAEPPVTTEPPIEAPSAESPPVPAETSSSFLDWLIQNWYFPVAALLLLGGLIFAFLRRRQEPDFAALGRLAQEHSREREEPKVEDQRSTTARLRALKKEDNFLVEESGEREQLRMEPSTRAPAAAPKPAAKATAAPKPKLAEEVQPEAPAKKSTEDTLSSETAINLDQGDPLAEADFHMAYGLYDQAADLVRIALEREPGRRELHLKLLEIYFVWGNKDAFLQAARELKAWAGEAPAGEWDKIVIMGKQIAPEDPLFAGAGTRAGPADVDLNLEEGDNPLDLDILGPETQSGNRAVDLDLSTDGSDSTNEMPDLKGSSGIDFVFDEPTPTPDTSATTREMPARASGSSAEAEAPTVESPALRDKSSSTIREKIESAHFRKAGRNTDQTAELAIDDLGLDVNALGGGGGKTESLDAMEETDHPRDETGETAHTLEALEETDHPEDAATLLASLDDTARNRLARAESGEEDDPDRTRSTARIKQPEDSSPTTGTWVIDDEAIMTSPAVGAGDATVRTPSPRKSDRAPSPRKPDDDATADLMKMGAEEVELDLSSLEAALSADTVQQPRPGGADEDRFSSDVFGGSQDFTQTDTAVDPNGGGAHADSDRDSTRTERLPAQEMDLPELEPVTMSEVGTKLDLARAYLDMGDPEGARSILDEVMEEGTATQKQEAQRLIESLPG